MLSPPTARPPILQNETMCVAEYLWPIRAARAYYYTVLRHLDKATVTDAIDREIAISLEKIDGAQFESTAQRRMAQT